jgi:hypothetical protein
MTTQLPRHIKIVHRTIEEDVLVVGTHYNALLYGPFPRAEQQTATTRNVP